jgi:hypothetical protein
MKEEDIKIIARSEAQRIYSQNQSTGQFGVNQTSFHTHNGTDSPKVSQKNIIPNMATSGSITFAHIGNYTLNINPNNNPTTITCYGIVNDGATPTVRCQTFGTAHLGPSYYFQPNSDNSVVFGGPVQQFIQSSTYLAVINGGTFYALNDEENLVDIEYPVGTIHARLTLVAYSLNTITLKVPYLDSGWQIIVNLVMS